MAMLTALAKKMKLWDGLTTQPVRDEFFMFCEFIN